MLSDEELYKKVIKKNCQQSMELLIQRYSNKIFQYIYSKIHDYEASEDLTQETFIKAYQKKKTYKSAYPFKAWLYKIAYHTVVDYTRSKAYKAQMKHECQLMDDMSKDSHNVIDMKIQQLEVMQLLTYLNDQQREVVELRFYEGLTLEEIASITDCKLNTVKGRLYGGLKRMKEVLQYQEGGDQDETKKSRKFI